MKEFINKTLPDERCRTVFFDKIKEYGIIDFFDVGKSILGKKITAYKIGNGKKHVLYVAAHHGSEYISASVLMSFVLFMTDKLTRAGTFWGINTEFLLQKFTFWVIPCLNPDGVELAINGLFDSLLSDRLLRMNGSLDFTHWQANARGVDLNHNYDFGFLEYKRLELQEGISEGRTRYSGNYPESEPETSALASFIRTLMPHLVISLHSQGREIYFSPVNGKTGAFAERVGNRLSYKVAHAEGLSAYGGLSDYTGGVLSIPSLTLEIGKGENPLPFATLPKLSEALCPILYLAPTLL